jgi:YjjG family noncanonical pyrimidine nucleotidase
LRYSTILLDLDHTLFDSDTSESVAFDVTMADNGIPNTDALQASYQRINLALWARVERGELPANEVALCRFEQLVEHESLDADPRKLADDYTREMGANGDLYPGASEVLDRLSESATLALVTNGIGRIQRTRIDRLGIAEYFDTIVISGEVGVSKPGRAFFDLVFDNLDNPPKRSVLMVGDSLSSDIRGGSDYGLDTCWLNSNGSTARPDDRGSFEIRELSELIPIVEGS